MGGPAAIIQPTVGSTVFYRQSRNSTPYYAVVTHVRGASSVNITIADPSAPDDLRGHEFQGVMLRQLGVMRPDHEFCEWMPESIAAAMENGEISKDVGHTY